MIGRMLGNRYEILEKIGEGGMAKVYKARCHLLNRIVAIKILRPEFAVDEEFVKRFRRESQAAASLSHPNIVSIYDVGQDGDIYYIVMEYVKGITLKNMIIENKGPLGITQAVDITMQVARALDHAHKNHIVHRDIKPQNILVTEDNIVKVTDFGIARAVNGSTLTYSGDVLGTAYYFSPEQARGGITDEKTDIYSLGIVMYEMLTGKVPFEGDSPISVALKHIQENIIPPSKFNNKIPKQLEDIILKATKKNLTLRYQNAGELLKDLETFLRNPSELKIKDFEENNKTKVIPSGEIEKLNRIYKNEDKRKIKNKTLKTAGIVLLILLLLASLSYGTILVLNNIFKASDVVVPNIVGMSFNQASKTLADYNLKIEISDEKYSDKPENTILSQDPSKATTVKSGSTVFVVVSKGKQFLVVPNVINQDYQDAKIQLENAGLKANIIEQYNDKFPLGFVFDQNPRQGVQVEYNTTIDLYVSKGIEPATVPNLVNMTLDNAKSALENAGLKLGKVIYKETNDVSDDVVLEQSVPANTEVQKGASIDLIVSKTTTNSGQEQTKNIVIDLPNKPNTMKVEVYVVQNDQRNLEFSGNYTFQQSPVTIPVKGTGNATIQIYIDGQLYKVMEANF